MNWQHSNSFFNNNSSAQNLNTNYGFNQGTSQNQGTSTQTISTNYGFNKGNIKNENKIKKLEDNLEVLEKKVKELSTNNKNANINHYVSCTNCKKNNIVGTRYLCGNCHQSNIQYNLCDKCITYREALHPDNHFFIMIHDSRFWGK